MKCATRTNIILPFHSPSLEGMLVSATQSGHAANLLFDFCCVVVSATSLAVVVVEKREEVSFVDIRVAVCLVDQLFGLYLPL